MEWIGRLNPILLPWSSRWRLADRAGPGHARTPGAELPTEAVRVLERGAQGHDLRRALYALGTHPETDRIRATHTMKRARDTRVERGAD